jgi:hypothetical protein
VRLPGQVSHDPPAVPGFKEGQPTVERTGYPHPASRSGESGLRQMPQPVRLQEHRVVNQGRVNADSVTDSLR